MTLCAWLILVADPGIPARERNNVAGHILSTVGGWAKPYLFRVAPCRLGEDDVDEAVQHLLTRCALGTSRFKGTTEGEAHAWCMRVLSNKGRDICRGKRRLVTSSIDSTGSDDDDDRSRIKEPSVEPDGTALAVRSIQTIFEAIHAELPRLHRKQDIEGILRSVRVHVEARMGASIEEQCSTYGDTPAGAAPSTKVQNRIYQYRNRGRKAACDALDSLVAQGRFATEDVEDARRLLGCDVVSGEIDAGAERKVVS